MRQYLLLAIGLGIGIAGTLLFLQSEPPEPESLEERAVRAELALAKAEQQIEGYQAVLGETPRGRMTDTLKDRARSIAEDIKAGRPVTVDDVFDVTKPLMRDLAPLFERMHLYNQNEFYDTMAGELSREYDLDPAQEQRLEDFLEQKAKENARRYMEVLTSDSSRFKDFVRASQNFEFDDDIDVFMEGELQGEELAQYQSERMNERLTRVQNEADRNVQRLDGIVSLDEKQKDEMFVFMARSSRHFDPSMEFEGVTGQSGQLSAGERREAAIISILRPEQRTAFEEYRQKQRDQAEKGIGLALPDDWDLFDDGGW